MENTKIFKVLSDNNRLRILKMLQAKSLCVCEVQDILGLAASTVSKHLSILRDAGFITEEKDGKWVNYTINQHPKDLRISSLLSSLDFWISDEETIISDKKKIKSSEDAFHLLYAELSDKTYEEFWVLLLDRANQVTKKLNISEGGMAGTVADPKKIFKMAYQIKWSPEAFEDLKEI